MLKLSHVRMPNQQVCDQVAILGIETKRKRQIQSSHKKHRWGIKSHSHHSDPALYVELLAVVSS